MANGERCTVCGYQETTHDDPSLLGLAEDEQGPCSTFTSPVNHAANCIRTDNAGAACNGDCQSFKLELKSKAERNRPRFMGIDISG